MASKKLDLTDERISPFKVIIWLAWPLFLEQILSTFVSFADTAMVGALGKNATASVSISNSFVFLINGVMMALGTGITAYVARSVGAKDHEAAKAYIRHALILLTLVGLPMSLITVALHRAIPQLMGAAPEILDTAASYLLITSLFRIFTMAMMVLGSVFRGRGDTKTPLRINIFVNILNVVGNYLLINPTHTVSIFGLGLTIPGAGWGVNGAAISTGVSWFVGGTALAVMLFVKDDPSRISLRDSFRPDGKLLRRVVDLSVPAMLERFCMSFASIIVARAVASLGTTAVAANSVTSTCESISFMPAFAFATAVTTLVGQALGAKKPALAEKYNHYTILLGAGVMTLAGVGLFVFAQPMVRIITPDPDVIAAARVCLRVVAVIQPIQTMAWIYAGALRGAGDTKWPFIITAICNWAVRVAGVLIVIRAICSGLALPMTEAMFAADPTLLGTMTRALAYAVAVMCLDNLCRCVWMSLRFHQGHWKHALEDKEKKERAEAAGTAKA